MDWRSAMRLAFADGVARRALIVALIVGTLLNLINQGDSIVTGQALNWWKLALTFVVPYCVSTHGAIMARWATRAKAP